MPNTLDLGAAPQPLDAVLPTAVLQRAARLQHWLVEDAKTARAFLKRVHEMVPLQQPLQALSITELPRAAKGRPVAPAAARTGAMGGRGTPGEHGGARAGPAAQLLAPAVAGHDMGLLSEAGLPGVADPGAEMVAAAHALGLVVVPLPGASSLMLALAASGLHGQRFAFVGYLPQDAAARRTRIRELESRSRQAHETQIFIETPYRNGALLAAVLECAAPATQLAVSVGLTLPEGWSRTATIAEWRRSPPGGALSDRMPAVFLLQA
ncbi:MAG: SAM-dependent methyltransferase [Rubrivivax sp.]|nr:SAM-dependent methyltransferase [Rubrivivax sp.]